MTDPVGRAAEGALALGAADRAAIVAHARRDAPRECCGLLLGWARAVLGVHPARNVLESDTRYQVDPRDHLDAMRLARAAGLDVIGVYHSHPGGSAVPSTTDLEEAWEDFFYLIVWAEAADTSPSVRAWRVAGRNFVEVPLVTPTEEVTLRPCAPAIPLSHSPS